MDDLELIKQKINVVDLVGEYLPLKKTGVNFKANCPFHNEKTPSFVVSPERGIWHCFGCDKGGDIFKFVMEKEGIDFKEALEILAQKAGVVLKNNGSNKTKGINERILELNLKASQFFSYILTEHELGKRPLEYLTKRGLTPETIKQFGLGYAPKNWEAVCGFLRKRGFTDEELIQSGIAVPSKKSCYDRFRGRIVFPLIDTRGRIIGFSGRVLDDSQPKYINTPQTPVFDKGKFLLGLSLSRDAIREKKTAILVEGEMDMIMSYQSGIKNIVASKGTALTSDQINLIKKYTDTIALCFDTDLAGDEASRRGIEMAEALGLNIKVVEIEGGKDPGEICLKDPKLWEKAVESAVPIYDYYLQSVEKRYDLKTAFGKKKAFEELLPIWKRISDSLTREHYVEKLAALLMVKEDVVRKGIKEQPIANAASWKDHLQVVKEEPGAKDDLVKVSDRRMLLEEYLISLILHIPVSHTYVPNFPETLFTQESLRQIYVSLVIFLDSISFKGKAFKVSELIAQVPEELVERVDKLYLMQIDEKLMDAKYYQREVDGVVAELKKMLIKSSLEKLSMEIKNAETFEKLDALQLLNKRFRDLSVKLKNL